MMCIPPGKDGFFQDMTLDGILDNMIRNSAREIKLSIQSVEFEDQLLVRDFIDRATPADSTEAVNTLNNSGPSGFCVHEILYPQKHVLLIS